MKIQSVFRGNLFVRLIPTTTLAAGCLLWAFGCTGEIRRNEDFKSGVEPGDVPIPTSFELLESRAYQPDIPESNFRSSFSKYATDLRVGEIPAVFVEEMPKQGWKFQYVADRAAGDIKELLFYKDDDQATIRIYRGYHRMRGGYSTIVETEVGPRAISSFKAWVWLHI